MLTPPAGRTGLTLVAAAWLEVLAALPVPEALAAAFPVVAAAVPLAFAVSLAVFPVEAGDAVSDAAAVVFAAAVLEDEVVSVDFGKTTFGDQVLQGLLTTLRIILPPDYQAFNPKIFQRWRPWPCRCD